MLYRYALLRIHSPDLAADLVQETFVEALRSRSTFAGRSTERTWLIGILRHKIGDQIRGSRRSPAGANGLVHDGSDQSPFDRHGHWRVRPAAWPGDPCLELQTREFWEVFGRCLSKLPKGIADAFFLRELDGMTAEEVQQALGISAANCWKRLHRARILLRACLEKCWFGRTT
jgi:RNA polymerase sigma-70 factor (ECF subfamily)